MNDRPTVSVVVANFNGARHIEAAVKSALRQTLSDLEVIIVDDGSTDASLEVAHRLAEGDSRVQVVACSANRGPAAARNAGFAKAGGRWLAVLDSDDLMHPRRLERLVAEADDAGADIIADDLMVFRDAGDRAPRRHLRGRLARASSWIDAGRYVESNAIYSSRVCLGYLKPLFRRSAIQAAALATDETLAIGEDSNFVARCMTAGLTFRLSPFPSYLYRRHDASLSRVLSNVHLEALLAASRRDMAVAPAGLTPSYRRYCGSLLTALAFGRAVEAIKSRRLGEALTAALQRPGAIVLFTMPIAARIGRIFRALAPAPRPPDPAAVCVLSRQRLVGATNGSSAYLIALSQALRSAGLRPHLLQPSPVVFGRWPAIALRPEMGVFETIRVRGAIRLGPLLVCVDPRVWLAAGRYGAARILQRANLPHRFVGAAPAPYAIGAPWRPQDLLFVARHAVTSSALFTDYAFQNEAAVYAVRAQETFVVMHDLFHRRGAQFAAVGASDSVASLTPELEIALLDLADVVVAIQDDEAEEVRQRLPRKRVVVAPMGVEPRAVAQPGSGSELLFAGSNNAANVAGLGWFFAEVWPQIRASAPGARLTVVGSIARAFAAPPDGVSFVGVVKSLEAAYARAAVVICPLTAGSGLKIKLVEALANGKAVVATPVALQGVETIAGEAVCLADGSGAFASSVTALLGDAERRQRLGEAGLAVVRRHFSPEVAFSPVVDELRALGLSPGRAAPGAKIPATRPSA